jgi:hypothetical protein
VRAVSPFARGGTERPAHTTATTAAAAATTIAAASAGVSERGRVFWADAGTRTVSVQRRSRSSSSSSSSSSVRSRSSGSSRSSSSSTGEEQCYSQIDSLDEQLHAVKPSVNSGSRSVNSAPSTAAATVVSRYSIKVIGRGATAAATTTAGVYSQLDALDIR